VADVALVDIVYSDATCRVGTSRNLFVYAWYDAPTLSQLQECGRLSRAMHRRHPQGTALLDLMVAGTPRFSEEIRAETTRLTAEPTTATLGVADVILLGGLAGVAVRTFINTVNLLGRTTRPHKVFSEVAPAAAWLGPKLSAGPERWTSADVAAVAADMLATRPAPRA
jgi:hypothetical protein